MIANKIEHTVLKADISLADIENLCNEAIQHQFYGVCIPPYFIKYAKNIIDKSEVKIVTVVGFPLGYNTTPAKVEEARKAIDQGADEIDMVINIAALKNNDLNYVRNDIQSVMTLVQLKSKKLKVIFETALISKEEKLTLCEICSELGVDFVKTSTGFAGPNSGATVEDIILMRANLPAQIKIKASGGIANKQQALDLIQAGADRLGTSKGAQLIE